MAYEDPTAKALRSIFGSGADPAIRNQARYIAADLPGIGPIIQAQDNWNYINDYMSNRGLSWDDVKYASRLGRSGSGGILSFVSSNIERLYK